MQIMLHTGLAATAAVFILFGALWIHESRKRYRARLTAGRWFDAAGFGFLPGMAVWKIFEPYCGLETGEKKLFDPLGPIPFLTRGERFAPDRIELAAILAVFTVIVIWLIARKQPLPGNGDLFLTVICIWSAVRMTTEGLRGFPVRFSGISVVILSAVIVEIVTMAIWTARRERRHKNTAMTLLEWAAVMACGVICILQDARILNMGSEIANLAVAAGCSILSAALILSAGKDSREA